VEHLELVSRLAQSDAATRIVLLVLDGVGGIVNAEQPQTALEAARTPHFDALAAAASLGRIVPVATGITPGSGPGHLALFGYDPAQPETDIGRGVLEALGLGLTLRQGDVAARGNFATADAAGNLTDRRAGRIPTAECRRVCAKLSQALAPLGAPIEILPGEAHRFVLLLRGSGWSPALADTDPQRLGVPPLPVRARDPAAEPTAELLRRAVEVMHRAIADEPQANRVLLRGFAQLPSLRSMNDLYRLRCGAFAGYPLYRGVAAACGMEVVDCGKRIGEILDQVAAHWSRFDFFFLHVKQTDQAGEDGNLRAKREAIEEVDAALPRLLALRPDVLAVTGDHSTPAPMRAHSFHPVPLLVASRVAFAEGEARFTERAAARGQIGDIRSCELLGLLLAHAGRLAKYGA
jgi:2,3-bisphosphoglycerate-independent phosphoglycerate mutase